jgi:hypothetical protein
MIGDKLRCAQKKDGHELMQRDAGAWDGRPTLWFWDPMAHLLQAFVFRAN